MSSHSRSTSTDRARRLLADGRRRETLQYLIEDRDRAVLIDELVTGITDRESSPSEGRRDGLDRLTIELHHDLLPRLAEDGVVADDPRSTAIRYRPREPIESLHHTVSNVEDKGESRISATPDGERMRKQEYVHVHGLLVEIIRHLSERGDVTIETPAEYETLDAGPMTIHGSKQAHHEAVMVLATAIETGLEQTTADGPALTVS